MTTESLLLILLAAALHATWNLLSKRASSAGSAFVFAFRCFSVLIYAPWMLYALAGGAMSWSPAVMAFILLSSALHLAYSLCLLRGYQVADLSVVYPIARGTGPLLTSVGAFLWLTESASAAGLLGLACVVGGIVLIATQGQWQKFRAASAWQGVRWGLLIGLFIAGYSLVDAYTVKTLLVLPILLEWFSCLGATLMLAPHIWRTRGQFRSLMRGKWVRALLVGALSPLAYILVLYALQQGAPVSLAAPLRETSMMLATLAGAWLLRERVSPARWAGCATIVAGVALLAAA